MLFIAAPGQGAQTPGFLSGWLELPGFADRLGAWSELAVCDLIRCGTSADADEIRDTAVAQPLLVAAAIATALDQVVTGAHPVSHQSVGLAGHSVGELAAGVLAGVITAEDAMRLVRVRATGMAAAAAAAETGMTAVLGGDEAAVLAAIEACGLTPANVNGAGQIVAAGTMTQLAGFAADPPAGARLRPLSVAGAFHTHHMAPAVDALAAADVQARHPARPLLSNRDGAVVKSGPDWLDRIINQVSAPVRWDMCMQTMESLGVTALIELPPAGTLTGLAKRALRGIQIVALKTPDDLDAARALLAEHADSHDDHHAPEWRLLVAPLAGVFRAPDGRAFLAGPGAMVGQDTDLGRVEMRGGDHMITTPFPAAVLEWLVEDGDPVNAGQPLVRLLPTAVK